jgi:cytochrome c oxidase assembly factor CtaG
LSDCREDPKIRKVSIKWHIDENFRAIFVDPLAIEKFSSTSFRMSVNRTYVGWHIPTAYEFALASENWHNFEHLCFFATSVWFWWPIVQPWPARPMSANTQ